jgi:Predicted transmembrane sensor domain
VIAVDEVALAEAAPGAPLRRALAETVRALGAEGAAAVVVDFLLLDETDADAALAAALRDTDAAILAVAALEEGGRPLGAFDPASRAAIARAGFGIVIEADRTPPPRPVAAPTRALLEAAPALGHVNVSRATDRVVRRAPLALELGEGVVLPAAPALAAARFLGLGREELVYERGRAVAFGSRRVGVDALGRALIAHRGAAGVFDRVTLGAFLGGARPKGGVAGRMIFVGATAESLGDIAATPLDPDAPGVESLAALAAQIVDVCYP